MAIKRITISVSDELADRIKEVAGDKPVSAWVTEVLERELDHEQADRLWAEFMAEVEISQEDHEWAERVIDSALAAGSSGDEYQHRPARENAA